MEKEHPTNITTEQLNNATGTQNHCDYSFMQQTFLQMLSEIKPFIIKICIDYTDSQKEASEDLFQDIICTLWEAWPNFRGESKASSWAYRIAVNKAVDNYRKRKKNIDIVPLEDWMGDIEDNFEASHSIDYNKLLNKLDSRDRILISLRLEHKSIKKIAQVLGTTEPAMKQKYYRLRQKIQKIVSEEIRNEEDIAIL